MTHSYFSIAPEAALDTQDIAARLAILLAPRYHVLRLIGIGGMASVYLVRHRIHHGLFAVKVLHPTLADQPDLLARFRREGLFGARLAGHPNIAPVLDVGEGDGLHYLLMPYIRGEDLDHILARTGPFCFDDAMFAAIQVNEALLHACNNGVLHGDLTPGNIRLNEFSQFILVDFGLASTDLNHDAHTSNEPESNAPYPGTPLYMSPERLLGERIDIRSDLYALGAILYEMLTGEAAFQADSIPEVERKHLSESRSFHHPHLVRHPGIQTLLQSLLALSPAERFSHPLELKEALRALANHPLPTTLQPEIDNHPEIGSPRRRLTFRES